MADNIVHENPGVGIIANVDCLSSSERFPLAVNIIYEINKRGWAIGWAKGYNSVSPLDSIRPLKSEFFLAGKDNSQLVVTGRSIVQPHPLAHPKFLRHSGIAARNWVGNNSSHQIQRDVVHTEPPHKVFNVADMLLMRLRHKDCFK
jgi:hypothetical protein